MFFDFNGNLLKPDLTLALYILPTRIYSTIQLSNKLPVLPFLNFKYMYYVCKLVRFLRNILLLCMRAYERRCVGAYRYVCVRVSVRV